MLRVAACLRKLDAPGILGLHFPDVEAPPAIEVAISGKPAMGTSSTHASVRYAWQHREYAARTASTSYPGACLHCRLCGRLGWTCSCGPSSGLGSRSVVVCAAAADLRRLTWLTCLSRATASSGRIALRVQGNLGQNCWMPRRFFDRALMLLMRRLGVDLSSSESS
jgi:hypothetical protein